MVKEQKQIWIHGDFLFWIQGSCTPRSPDIGFIILLPNTFFHYQMYEWDCKSQNSRHRDYKPR